MSDTSIYKDGMMSVKLLGSCSGYWGDVKKTYNPNNKKPEFT